MEAENTARELQEEVVRLKTEIEDLKGNGAKEVTKLNTKIEVLKEEVVRLTTENDSLKKRSGGTSWNPFRGNRAHMQTLLEDLNNCRE